MDPFRKSTGILRAIYCILLPGLMFLNASSQTILAEITVDAGNRLRIQTPMVISLGKTPLIKNAACLLKPLDRSAPADCQIQNNQLYFILPDTLHPGEKKTFFLYKTEKSAITSITSELNQKSVLIKSNGRHILEYHHATSYPAKGVDSVYKRSGFIHPLWSPEGNVLTRIRPPDHYHHYGIWNPWTKTRFEGRPVDFWNLNKNQGAVEHVRFESIQSGPVYGGFHALLDHLDKTSPGGSKTALHEKLSVRVWNINDDSLWLIDYVSGLFCASGSPVLLEKYRYGGFGFRARGSWTNKNSWVLTSEGNTRKNADGTRGKWCIVGGATETGTSGIVFMGHPGNREFPEPMRIWPEEMNGGRGDVFFNFCPVKEKNWNLEPGKQYQLRYRMLVFEGTILPETAERFWQDFADPPQTKITFMNH